jgi:hypothetical protein
VKTSINSELCKKIVKSVYPDLVINNIEIIPRNILVEGKWVEDLPAIFVGIGSTEHTDISETLTKLSGLEFNVFIS